MKILRGDIISAVESLGFDAYIVKSIRYDTHRGFVDIYVYDREGKKVVDKNHDPVTATVHFDIVDYLGDMPF